MNKSPTESPAIHDSNSDKWSPAGFTHLCWSPWTSLKLQAWGQTQAGLTDLAERAGGSTKTRKFILFMQLNLNIFWLQAPPLFSFFFFFFVKFILSSYTLLQKFISFKSSFVEKTLHKTHFLPPPVSRKDS